MKKLPLPVRITAFVLGGILLLIGLVWTVEKFIFASFFFKGAKTEMAIPGLWTGFVPQGFEKVDEDFYLMSGYDKDGKSPSVIYTVKDGKKTAYKLYNKDGSKTYTMKLSRPHGNMVIAKIEGVDTVEAAQGMRNRILYMDRADVKLPEGSYFVAAHGKAP